MKLKFSVLLKRLFKILSRLPAQRFFSLKKKSRKAFKPGGALEENISFYSLDSFQLQNLLAKNIYFEFFQLEDFPLSKEALLFLKKARRKNSEEVWPLLKGGDLKRPVVLICRTGLASQKLQKELMGRGLINVYFLSGGAQSLSAKKE